MTDSAKRPTTSPLSSGLKLLRLLTAISETTEPFRIADLAREVDTTRAEVHRQVVTLAAGGWLTRLADGRYALTMRAAHLGNAAMAHAGLFDRAATLIAELAERVGEAASLAVLDEGTMRIVQRAEPGRALYATVSLGSRMAVWSSASGRALIAHANSEVIARLTEDGVQLPTPAELAAIREQGYAVSVDEPGDDLLAVAVHVGPDSHHATGALSVVGPHDRVKVPETVAALRQTANGINRLLQRSRTFGEEPLTDYSRQRTAGQTTL